MHTGVILWFLCCSSRHQSELFYYCYSCTYVHQTHMQYPHYLRNSVRSCWGFLTYLIPDSTAELMVYGKKNRGCPLILNYEREDYSRVAVVVATWGELQILSDAFACSGRDGHRGRRRCHSVLYSLEVGVSSHLCRSDAPVEHVTLAFSALYSHSLFREGRWIFRLNGEHAKAS